MEVHYGTEKICAYLHFQEPSVSLFIDTPPYTPLSAVSRTDNMGSKTGINIGSAFPGRRNVFLYY